MLIEWLRTLARRRRPPPPEDWSAEAPFPAALLPGRGIERLIGLDARTLKCFIRRIDVEHMATALAALPPAAAERFARPLARRYAGLLLDDVAARRPPDPERLERARHMVAVVIAEMIDSGEVVDLTPPG
jgi:hypothetical protein